MLRQFPDYRAGKPGIAERKELSIMLIYIEVYPKDRLLDGPKCSMSEPKKRLIKVLIETETKDFILIFCVRCNFEEMLPDNVLINENIKVDYYMDIDVGPIRKLSR